MSTVREKIAEKLGEINPTVIDQVVEAMVDREIKKRSEAIVKAIDKLAAAEKELLKLGKDQKFYNEDGTVDVETFSKARLDERNKKLKQIERLTSAINKAIDKGDMQDVYQLAGGKEPGGEESKGETTGETN